ncbi:metal ABC transporter substrate-binding protein [Pokkaliibacter plantistimulans]|uniref:Metal ABC transporter substrate-binding protein n=2 Tax=Pseudomonadota TaxID=1224 RepID=A0A2S5KGV4_9PROT|nr:metal ABC transporter substrate-binding protein [Pokkaliibacter plantistimulans]
MLSCGFATSVWAQTSIKLGYTGIADFAAGFVAKDKGFFAKHGLDVDFVQIAINSNIPAALLSDSVQVGGPTPTVFLQAVAGGLDLVAIAGTTVTSKSIKGVGVVAKTGEPIKSAHDFEGKVVGVPGIGASLQVLFRQWMKEKGADASKVRFVEVSFPTMNDVLKAGTVDAVVTASPMMDQIIGTGTGYNVASFLSELPEGKPTMLYSTTREWAVSHPTEVVAFRTALAEAASYVESHQDETRQIIGNYIKLPPAALQHVEIAPPAPVLAAAQIYWWIQVMQGQNMLETFPADKELVP